MRMPNSIGQIMDDWEAYCGPESDVCANCGESVDVDDGVYSEEYNTFVCTSCIDDGYDFAEEYYSHKLYKAESKIRALEAELAKAKDLIRRIKNA